MAEVGDRVEVMSRKGGARSGVVTAVTGGMITVRWESGEESSLVPGPGALRVVPGRRSRKAAQRPATSKKTAAKKITSKKTAAKKATSSKTAARTPAKKSSKTAKKATSSKTAARTPAKKSSRTAKKAR